MTLSINFIEETEKYETHIEGTCWCTSMNCDEYHEAYSKKLVNDIVKTVIHARESALIDLLLEELPKEGGTSDVCRGCGGTGEPIDCKGGPHLHFVLGYDSCLQDVKQKLLEVKKQLT